MTEEQKIWAEKDIAIASENSDWVFVFFHHTLLTTGTSRRNWDLQSWMVPIADKFGVDGVFFAHDHHYEHWFYEYGKNGLVYDPIHIPSGEPIHYFVSGGGGAQSEYSYGLLGQKKNKYSDSEINDFTTEVRSNEKQKWYDLNKKEWITKNVKRSNWSRFLYIDHTDNPAFGLPSHKGKQFYHWPPTKSFSTDNEHYGYDYGEQTLNYMKIETLGKDGLDLKISAHYPNGDIISGPEDVTPQVWTFRNVNK